MAQKSPQSGPGPIRYKDDFLSTALEWAGSKCLWLGIIVTLACTAGLVYYAVSLSTNPGLTPQQLEDAKTFIGYMQAGLTVGLIIFAIGMSVSFWGDIALPVTLLLAAVAYFTATIWMPMMVEIQGLGSAGMLAADAVKAMSFSGIILGIYAIGLQVIDAVIRTQNRSKHGSKGDLMKYGSGVKEEPEFQNRFMGRCYQLPFCRKFVRERCPIFHAKRTCWKERVGCMCEEDVIRGAMESKTIPKDVVTAAKFIPRNDRFTPEQKAERCRQCVIYNEHQRHKYKLVMPMTCLFVFGIYGLMRPQLLAGTLNMVHGFDKAMSKFTIQSNQFDVKPVAVATTPGLLEEILLFCMILFILAQLMKLVEYCIFKLKI